MSLADIFFRDRVLVALVLVLWSIACPWPRQPYKGIAAVILGVLLLVARDCGG